jgi:ethanolamine kinase
MHISSSVSPNPSSTTTAYFNNADIIAPLEINISSSNQSSLQQQVYDVLQEIFPSFLAKIPQPHDLKIQPLTGGLSNHLFTVRSQNGCSTNYHQATSTSCRDDECPAPLPPTILLVRIHDSSDSDNEDPHVNTESGAHKSHYSTVDREYENRISAVLSSLKLAPLFYGRFQNGRLEEFYEDVRPLSHTEMGISYDNDGGTGNGTGSEYTHTPTYPYTVPIAQQLGKLHRVQLDESLSKCNGDHCYTWEIYGRIEDWIQVSNDLHGSSIHSQERMILEEIQGEWKWLSREIGPENGGLVGTEQEGEGNDIDSKEYIQRRAIRYCRDVVFTHMDCQSLNILTPVTPTAVGSTTSKNDRANKEIRLIDFEYAGMNPRAVDLGNTFAEFCDMNNLKPDYEREYPSEMCQNVFLLNYICASDDVLAEEIDEMTADGKELFLSIMRDVIGKHSLLSHLGWACWALIMSKTSTIEFEYVAYAKIRMDGYRFFKSRHWPVYK